MRRRLFTFFSALSLLLCLAVCGLWVRSYSVRDLLNRLRSNFSGTLAPIYTDDRFTYAAEDVRIISERGAICFYRKRDEFHASRVTFAPPSDHAWRHKATTPASRPPATPPDFPMAGAPGEWALFGFRGYAATKIVGNSTSFFSFDHTLSFAFPHWFPAVLTTILPAFWIRTARRHCAARAAGHCPQCGYDLRATPDRCPECGTTPPVR